MSLGLLLLLSSIDFSSEAQCWRADFGICLTIGLRLVGCSIETLRLAAVLHGGIATIVGAV